MYIEKGYMKKENLSILLNGKLKGSDVSFAMGFDFCDFETRK